MKFSPHNCLFPFNCRELFPHAYSSELGEPNICIKLFFSAEKTSKKFRAEIQEGVRIYILNMLVRTQKVQWADFLVEGWWECLPQAAGGE